MNKTIKRLLSGFLALVMAIALIPFNAVMTVKADVDTPAEGTFYVDTDLVDYFNDSRIENGKTTGYNAENQGTKSDDMNKQGQVVPYSYFNGVISNKLSGKLNYYKYPLYFGSLLHLNNRVGRIAKIDYSGNLNKWSSTVNVALSNNKYGNKEDNNLDASVQGLVDDTLVDGKLMSNGHELPYFSQTQASELKAAGHNVMEYYPGYKFPFKSSYNSATGVTTYSYDSATDYAVYLDWENANNKVLQKSDTHILNKDESKGYFPLNKAGDSGDAVNYGFGTKFTIPFTINENGTIDGTKDGEPVTFTFTGDDDVWVFLDGKLILDMGGAHAKSTGKIDFKNLQAVVEDAVTATENEILPAGLPTNALISYQNKGLTNWAWDDLTERSTVASGTKTKNFIEYGPKFANSFKDSSKTHTLVMFYMERGMFDSNMSIEFTINPLPSGLSLSKTLDVSGVNTGLAEAVQEADNDNFNFAIQTKDLKDTGATYQNVENLGYSLNNYNNQDTAGYEATDSVITGVGARSFAHTFINTETGKDAFKGGTAFKITEDQNSDTVFEYDYTETKWTVYDKDNNYAVIKTYGETEDRLTAEFDMGSSRSSDFDTFDYDVNFRNTMKVNTLSLTKKWKEGQTAPSDGKYSFTVLIDLDGEDKTEYDYKAYTLDGDLSDTDASGKITLAAGDTVVFTGIPVGSSYKIIENIPEDANYSSDKTGNTVIGTIEGNSAASVTFTNGTKTTNVTKVVYAEAGSDPTAYTPSDVAITKATLTSSQTDGAKAEPNGTTSNQLDIVAPTANKKYVYKIEGTTSDGKILDNDSTLTVYSFKATDKVYVFDYGLESNIAATNDNGDGLFQNGTFYNTKAQESETDKTTAVLGTINDDDETTQTDIEAASDGVTINEDGTSTGNVTFKPVAFMDQVEKYKYTANITKNGTTLDSSNPETGTVVNGTIKVMPADVVYYEDNFNSETDTKDSSVKIVYTGDDEDITTEGTSLEITQSNGQTEQYGHDEAYNTIDNQKDSGGSSTKLTADGYNTKATFTFTGTGFDIIARTNSKTAGIVYTIEKYENGSYSLFRIGAVDTYYTNGELYQLPVIHEEMEYGTYRVTLGVKQTGDYYVTTDEAGNIVKVDDTRKYVVYLDGIRIYNPLGEAGNEAYIDEEEGATVSAVSKLVVGNGTVTETGIRNEEGSTINGQVIEGAKVAIAGYGDGELTPLGTTQTEVSTEKDSQSSDSILTYLNAGPNNELYLDETAALAFVVKQNNENATTTLQIEAKMVDTANYGGSEESKGLALRVLGVKEENVQENTIDTIETSTAMYYRINVEEECIPLGNGYYLVVILGNSDYEDGTHSLSFTNLKYKNYTVENPYDISEASDYLAASEETVPTKFVSIDPLTNLKKNTWYKHKHTITLTEDVFGTDEDGNKKDPQFTMYYVNAAGNRVEITVKARRSETSDKEYTLQFKTPNANGNFPVEIHYVAEDANGELKESGEFISTTMSVRKR